MQINSDDLRRHYASISDEELLSIERDDLTEVARDCYDREMQKRNLHVEPEALEAEDDVDEEEGEAAPEWDLAPEQTDEDPEWLPDAASACEYAAHGGYDAASSA